jgi:tRNA A-37 threonylcarbamoyl transferase component Bud32
VLVSVPWRKIYNRPELRWQKQREIDFLRKLDGVPHFPDLVAVDEESIYITDCGQQFTSEQLATLDLDNVEEQLEKILDLLEDVGIRHRDITVNNLMWKDGVLYLVDFGWSIWGTEEDSPEPVPQVMRWWMCDKDDRQQAAETLAKLREMKR